MDSVFKSPYFNLSTLEDAKSLLPDKVTNIGSKGGADEYDFDWGPREEADADTGASGDGYQRGGSSKAAGENNTGASYLCPSMPFKHRMIGFAACSATGTLLSIFSWIAIFKTDLKTFAFIYSVSNVIWILGTFFLCGPMRQLKNMRQPSRLIAILIFLAALAMTFVAAFAIKIKWLPIIFVVVQWLALAWYTITYIPFARRFICGLCGRK